MKAITLKGFGGVDQLTYSDIQIPTIKEDEVLVQIKAVSVNPVDVKTRSGKGAAGRLKDENPIILGWDISGIIKETGNAVTHFTKGDEVFGMVNFPGHGKAYAEYVAAPASQLAIKPKHFSFEEAAATTLAALTAWQSIHQHGDIHQGTKVLIHAASGGVGHFAVQIAKYLGAYVIGTSSAANKDFVLSIGADVHIDYHSQKLEDIVSNVDFVLDTIGGDNIDQSLLVMKPGGRIVSIPSGKNDGVEDKAKGKGMNGFSFMVQSNGEDMKALAELAEKGKLKPHVSKTFLFTQMPEAHLQIESGRTVGRIAVTL